MYIFHTWTRALNIFFFSLKTIDPIYLANKTLWQHTYTVRKKHEMRAFLSQSGKANFVLQRQAKKKVHPGDQTRSRFMHKKSFNLHLFLCSSKVRRRKLFYGFSREQWNLSDKSFKQTKVFIMKSRRNQIFEILLVYEKEKFSNSLSKSLNSNSSSRWLSNFLAISLFLVA